MKKYNKCKAQPREDSSATALGQASSRNRREAELEWVSFHDFRCFLATQWVRMGVDLRTVKELLGHADIQTTMRYARFVESALSEVRLAQKAEMRMGEEWETNGRQRESR